MPVQLMIGGILGTLDPSQPFFPPLFLEITDYLT